MDTNDLNYPMMLERQLGGYANSLLKRPPDFSGPDKMFSSAMANPSIMLGPGGSLLDPAHQQASAGSAYLNERGDIAQQSLADKHRLAQLLLSVGGNIGSMYANQTGLNAQITGLGGGLFGSGIGGFL